MKKLTVATKLYNEMSEVLYNAGEITVIPPLKKTTMRKVYGYLRTNYIRNSTTHWIEKKEYVGIYLNLASIPNYADCYDLNKVNRDTYYYNVELFFNAIDTIAHEFAHMKVHAHNEEHTKLTHKYMELYLNNCKYVDENTGKFLFHKFMENVKEHA